jgi:hypothetical protein
MYQPFAKSKALSSSVRAGRSCRPNAVSTVSVQAAELQQCPLRASEGPHHRVFSGFNRRVVDTLRQQSKQTSNVHQLSATAMQAEAPESASTSSMKTVDVHLGDRSYPIYIGTGLLDKGELLRKHIPGKRVLIVTNETIAPLYLEKYGP